MVNFRDLLIVVALLSGFGMGVLSMPSDIRTNDNKTQKAEKPLPEQKQASSLPEQIEVLCITGRLFVRDKYGHGSLVQVREGSSNSVACKD